MMTPRFSRGANIADLAPTATVASPLLSLRHSSNLSPCDNPLCNIATLSPNLSLNCKKTCGVSEISGTSIIAVLFFDKASSMQCIYTSVFPLPVTPCNKNVPVPFVISSTAFCWSGFNVGRDFLLVDKTSGVLSFSTE